MFVVGPCAVEKDFIGREEDIQKLTGYIRDMKNISITGLPRIGKSSLVKEVIRRMNEGSNEEDPLFFEFSLTRQAENKEYFYMALDAFLEDEIEAYNSDLMNSFQRMKARYGTSHQFYTMLYAKLYNMSKRPLYIVIDELDYAHESLGREIQNIREICICSCIRIITISRHSLPTIFPLGNEGSNFPGIFTEKIDMKGFTPEDVNAFRERFSTSYQGPIEPAWEKIGYYCGNIPILMSIFANKLLEDEPNIPDDLSGTVGSFRGQLVIVIEFFPGHKASLL